MLKRLGLAVVSLSVFTAAWGANELSNRRAPGFSLPDVNLKQHDLADYRGKVVLLNIMKTDCPHCGAFSKKLAAAQEKFGDQLQVLSIVNSPPENQNTVRAYQAQHGENLVMLFDCRQVAISYFKLTPSKPSFEVPHFFVIDQRGWIREDYGYDALNRGIFEGDDLFPIIERHVTKPSRAD